MAASGSPENVRLIPRCTTSLGSFDTVPGLFGLLMQRPDFERKFSDNVGGALSQVVRDRVLEFLWSIDRQPKLDPLFKLLLVSG